MSSPEPPSARPEQAPGTGEPLARVWREIQADPYRFDFFRAVRLIQAGAGPQRLGHSLGPAEDPVRFAQRPSLGFAPSTLDALETPEEGRPPRLWSRHFGLFGPSGPLPLHLTEYALQRALHHGDRAIMEFANVFHHRMLSFFFRAWADARKEVDLDRKDDQRWFGYFRCILGLGTEGLQERDSVADHAKVYYAGRLAAQGRAAEGLQAIVADYFGVPTELESFVGSWLTLPEDCCCDLGGSPSTGQLGQAVILGSRVWDCQLSFRLRLGPMSLATYERLLPRGRSFQRLRDWIRLYAGDALRWEVQLVLAAAEVPVTKLGGYGALGWTTWLKTQSFTADAADLILSAPAS